MTVNTGFFRRMGAICLMAAMIGAGCARADAVVVTAERLNIRSEATADSWAVTVVSAGETLKYVCEADDWIMVSIGSKTGYVMKKYVDIDDDKIIEDVAGALSLYTQSVTGTATARLNVRELPMSGCTALKVAGNGDSLELLGECGDWYRVNYGGKTGYVVQSGSCAASFGVSPAGRELICVTADASGSWRCIYDHVALYQKFGGA